MRLDIGEFCSKSQKSRFLTQNVRFPAWVGDISRRGIERSDHERLSRVSPRSFGQIVNFLEKSKISKMCDFKNAQKLALGTLWEPSPEPTMVTLPKYFRFAMFHEDICLKNFCLPKYAILVKIERLEYQNIAFFCDFWDIWLVPNRHQGGSTGRQMHIRARIRTKWLILRISCPRVIFRRNALVGFIFGFKVPQKIMDFKNKNFHCNSFNKSLRNCNNYLNLASIPC